MRVLSLVALAVLLGAPATHAAEIKLVKEWTGEVEDAKKLEEWPDATPVTNKDDFAKLWKSWNGKDKVPEIDFTKQFVLVGTNKKGQTFDVTLVELGGKKGTYVSTGTVKEKKVKGFTYTFTAFNRAGIKTLNDKPLK